MATISSPAPRTTVDQVTFEVIRHRLTAITVEQSTVYKRMSASPVVTDANDFNTGIYQADGSIVTMGPHVIYHAGSMSRVIRHVIADCSANPGIREGDAFIVNDPYKGALHPPDVTIVEPVFYQGEVIAWVGACGHQLDVGGMNFGSWCPKATEIQQEGIILPPTKLVEGGVVRQDLMNMILGMTRLPFILVLDLKAMIATNATGKRRLLELVARYGLETVNAVTTGLLDRSEQRMRTRLRELPDGTFRAQNFLDHDGHQNKLYTVAVELTKSGDGLRLDFAGSSAQAPGFVNCTESGLAGAVLGGLLPLLAYDIPWNEGILRAVQIDAPLGTIVNAKHPAPCGSATLAACWLAEAVTVEAASRMLACSTFAHDEGHATTVGGLGLMTVGGINQWGEPFGNTFTDQMAAGAGAYRHRRGTDYGGCHSILTQSIPNVETLENFSPMLYLRRNLTRDSGGPGRMRGGSAAGASWILHDAPFMQAVLESHGVQVPNSLGLQGGYPGSCNVYTIVRGSDVHTQMSGGKAVLGVDDVRGQRQTFDAKPGELMLAPGDVIEWTWQGGGGFADPLDAHATEVARDVAEGAVSAEVAERIYGVVLAPNAAIDADATQARRAQIRRARAARPTQRSMETPLDLHDAALIAPLGEDLRIVRTVDGATFTACICGRSLGPSVENWKAYAASGVISPDEAGPRVTLHADLQLREYACPGCGRLHSVELALRDSPPLHDADLALARSTS